MAYMTSILSLFEVPRLERRSNKRELSILGGGFKYVSFSSLLGEMAQFGQYVSIGLKLPTRSN